MRFAVEVHCRIVLADVNFAGQLAPLARSRGFDIDRIVTDFARDERKPVADLFGLYFLTVKFDGISYRRAVVKARYIGNGYLFAYRSFFCKVCGNVVFCNVDGYGLFRNRAFAFEYVTELVSTRNYVLHYIFTVFGRNFRFFAAVRGIIYFITAFFKLSLSINRRRSLRQRQFQRIARVEFAAGYRYIAKSKHV